MTDTSIATTMPPRSRSGQLELGLRWLDAGDDGAPRTPVATWREFLDLGRRLPAPRRFRWARLWPLLALLNGALAVAALTVWPDRSGVHMLLFLLAFWLAPVTLLVWTTLLLILGRCPWWRPLITAHCDPVIALWFGRQSLLAQGLFCLGGLGWLWLMLATRQVIFYWSTSIPMVSRAVGAFFAALGFGLLEPPPVGAAEAGAITGWQNIQLAASGDWALWLTQVVALWVLLPAVALLAVCQWLLARRLANWPAHNPRLRRCFERHSQPAVHYRALAPEQPPVEPSGQVFPRRAQRPGTPGFVWPGVAGAVPGGSVRLGEGSQQADVALVEARGGELGCWYVAAATVPTGDLADLLSLHRATSGAPALYILADDGVDPRRVADLSHSWGAFLDRHRLLLPVTLVAGGNPA